MRGDRESTPTAHSGSSPCSSCPPGGGGAHCGHSLLPPTLAVSLPAHTLEDSSVETHRVTLLPAGTLADTGVWPSRTTRNNPVSLPSRPSSWHFIRSPLNAQVNGSFQNFSQQAGEAICGLFFVLWVIPSCGLCTFGLCGTVSSPP